MILVSSCLAGFEVRYNGSHSLNKTVRQLFTENKAIPICPELLGGFTTPRQPAEILGGNGFDVLDGKAKVMEKSGSDVTDLYIKGAYLTLEKALEVNATVVILKEYSPSCGSSTIYNGEFENVKIAGNGVTTALLMRNGIEVVSEESINSSLKGILEHD
ncbi:uncharacterized protein YbbK (DUF523 family) [Metabacillus crassostreae]|uniref:DUF523 domain-containing protein n=1 Tax=Metabacillus crassostreae TaxID=929098 RepID=UPI00195AD819|nr:DUF523 domain-containing protein [Metabacillus crassostreae]MBM7602319.1 uncharacterized protein YbbK (DUF523 family) [Metabacillus crassostreae]